MPFGPKSGIELNELGDVWLHWLLAQDAIAGGTLVDEESAAVARGLLAERLSATGESPEYEWRRIRYARDRIAGMDGRHAEWIVEEESWSETPVGPCWTPRAFLSFEESLAAVARRRGAFADPHDLRIVIWEVLPAGHKKVAWHFSGADWETDVLDGVPQGSLAGETEPLIDRMRRTNY
jgi:hypothetical protein